MARSIIEFPAHLIKWRAFSLTMDSRTKAGAESTTGNGQVAFGAQPRWILSGTIIVSGAANVRTWRALVTKVRGRVNAVRVPIKDVARPSYTDIGLDADHIALLEGDGVPHSDDEFFDDDAGYDYEPAGALSASASAGATSITVDARPYGDGLNVGQWISIDDWIYQIVGKTGTAAARVYTIDPPLRRAASSGDVVQVWARGLFIFRDDFHGASSMSYIGNFFEVNISLEEWVNRA